jgi:hypothetical protein
MRCLTCLTWLSAAMLLVAATDLAHAAPKRPGNSWNACSPSGSQLQGLEQRNPGAMEACKNMAQQAQSQGKSFAFMCDPSGNVACCNDSNCVQVGALAMRPKVPRGLIPEQMPGTLQQSPTAPGGKPGMAPPPGGTMSPQIR